MYQTLRTAKREGQVVDVCLAGGRKTMSVYAMVAAQLLFEDDDRLWHLVSAGPLLAERRMHPLSGDSAALVALPVLRYGDVSPLYSEVAEADDPFEAVQRSEARAWRVRLARVQAFVREELTAAERRVVALLVREGLSDTEIAGRLVVAPRTVQTQLASAYRKAEGYFDLHQVSSRALVSLLAPIAPEL
jgi:DNA-binding CsgD family transcriptional regulator